MESVFVWLLFGCLFVVFFFSLFFSRCRCVLRSALCACGFWLFCFSLQGHLVFYPKRTQHWVGLVLRVCVFLIFFKKNIKKNSSLLLRVHLIRSLALSRLSIIIIYLLLFCLPYFRIVRWGIRFSVWETRVCAGEAVALDCRFGLLWRNGRSTHARLGCCWCIQRRMSIYICG